MLKNCGCCGRACCRCDLCGDDGAVCERLDITGRKLGDRSDAAFWLPSSKGRMTREVFENSVRNTLGITCMFMWIILAALAFGAVFDGLGAVKAIESLFTERA